MTDPASAIQREVHQLINSQIETLHQPSFLTDLDLVEYRVRAERIGRLYSVLDRIETDNTPQWHPRLRARTRRAVSGEG